MSPKARFLELTDALTPLYGAGEARSIARIAFEDYFKLSIQDDVEDPVFTALLEPDFLTIRDRLLCWEPVQYVVGFAHFYSYTFKVNPATLIPRSETEELVHWVLSTVKNAGPLSVLDVGTGSGCIAVTLKLKNPALQVAAVDVSEAALIVASKNAYRLQADVHFQRMDVLDAAQWPQLEMFDVVVSNPPYIPAREKTDMSKNVLAFEPPLALFVPDDRPLLFYETIANFALQRLTPGGYLFFECNEFNAVEVVRLLEASGFSEVELKKDMSGADRMVRAQQKNN